MKMTVKKLEFKDSNKTVVIKTTGDVCMCSEKIRKLLDLISTLEGVINGGLKKMEMINGPPIFDYYMESKAGRKFTETVTVEDLPYDDVLFTFNVPDKWSNKEITAYFAIRRLTTEMFLESFISEIVIEWN